MANIVCFYLSVLFLIVCLFVYILIRQRARQAWRTWTRFDSRTARLQQPTCACACRSPCRRTPPSSDRRARSRKVGAFIQLFTFVHDFTYMFLFYNTTSSDVSEDVTNDDKHLCRKCLFTPA